MQIFTKFIALSAITVLAACGAKSESSKTAQTVPDVEVTVSPELAYINLHIDLMHKIADELDLVNANTDAHRYKNSIAKNMSEMYNAKSKYEELIDPSKVTQLMIKTGHLNKQMDAMKRMGEAMGRLSKEHPEAYRIVATEINKAVKTKK